MSDETAAKATLPLDVVDALRAGRKIEAIKRLRDHRGLGLKEAKQTVEAYAKAHPDLVPDRPSGAEFGLGRLALLILILAAGYAAYQYL